MKMNVVGDYSMSEHGSSIIIDDDYMSKDFEQKSAS